MIRIPKTRTAKYGSKKTNIDGIAFDSQKEAVRYVELKRLKKAGVVTDFECQPAFELQKHYRKCCGSILLDTRKVGVCPRCGKKVPLTKSIVYCADFRVLYPDGHEEIEDVKGMETALFKLKRKMFEYRYPELTLKLVRKVRA